MDDNFRLWVGSGEYARLCATLLKCGISEDKIGRHANGIVDRFNVLAMLAELRERGISVKTAEVLAGVRHAMMFKLFIDNTRNDGEKDD